MRVLLLVFAFSTFLMSYGQKKKLNLSDAVLKSRSSLAPERLSNLAWKTNIDYKNFEEIKNQEFIYSGEVDGEPVYFKGNVLSNEVSVWLTAKEFKSLFSIASKKPLERLPRIQFSDDIAYIRYKNTYHFVDISNNKYIDSLIIPDKSEDHDLHPKSQQLAYTIKNEKGNSLFIEPRQLNKKFGQEITNGQEKGCVYGKAVHRYEFGISKGTFWSNSGRYLAFYKKDERMVSDYPLVDISSRPAALNSIKYPMAGDQSHYVQIGVFDTKNSSIYYLKIKGAKDQYLTNITWSPDENHIYVAIVNREQNHMKLDKYDASTGNLESTLFEEKNDKYVEPEHGPYFLNNDSKKFVWFSERSGYQHLYLYSSTGKLISTLTEGEWEVSKIIGNTWSDILLVEGTGRDGRSKSLYSVSLPSSDAYDESGVNVKLISSDKGYNSGLACKSGDFILKTYMSIETNREISLIDLNGKEYRTILNSDNPLDDYEIGSMEMLELKADDGTALYARMIKPSHFDPAKKYPVLVYVYGGPHAQMVKDTWLGAAPLWMYYMAEQGYLVFTLDNRGSANRGLAFEQVIHRQLGKVEMLDQLKGVEYLKSLDYVDSDRLGINGWSYGGYMTTSLMSHYPDIFKVGVAGGPVIDWKYYEVMYTERYMDTPEENPKGYEETSLLNHVDSLNGDLMLIHGTSDDVVVWQHSLDFVKKCISKGKQIDYFVYPGHKHNVYGKDRVHLIEKILNYFIDRL